MAITGETNAADVENVDDRLASCQCLWEHLTLENWEVTKFTETISEHSLLEQEV